MIPIVKAGLQKSLRLVHHHLWPLLQPPGVCFTRGAVDSNGGRGFKRLMCLFCSKFQFCTMYLKMCHPIKIEVIHLKFLVKYQGLIPESPRNHEIDWYIQEHPCIFQGISIFHQSWQNTVVLLPYSWSIMRYPVVVLILVQPASNFEGDHNLNLHGVPLLQLHLKTILYIYIIPLQN